MRRRRHSKKGFELAIGFIVILIITIIIFASSIVIVRKMFQQGETIKASLDAQAQRDIERLLTQGKQVAIVPATIEVEKGRTEPIGIGIMNVKNAAHLFYTTIVFSRAFDNQGEEIRGTNPETMKEWVLYTSEPVELGHGARTTQQVLIAPDFRIDDDANVDTIAGTYVYNLCVLSCPLNDRGTRCEPRLGFSEYQRTRMCNSDDKANFADKLYTQKLYKLKVLVD